MATEVGENTQVKANLAFMAKVIAGVGTAVWGYSVIWNKLATVEHAIDRVSHESGLIGDMSARLQAVEKYTQQHKKDVDHLMSLQDAPITSDYQQFERIKYLEKELDRMRDKLED
tara:strand:+ start:389 stop:733 length:345 start_codon:yes stop_codon:yes gene_type:complete